MVTARRDGLKWGQGVIVNKLEEAVKMYGYKVSIETTLESRVGIMKPM
jgi:N-acetyl-anhydromuramyl-L-alanine amidase AmpD